MDTQADKQLFWPRATFAWRHCSLPSRLRATWVAALTRNGSCLQEWLKFTMFSHTSAAVRRFDKLFDGQLGLIARSSAELTGPMGLSDSADLANSVIRVGTSKDSSIAQLPEN